MVKFKNSGVIDMQTARISAAVANVWRQPRVSSIDRLALDNDGLSSWLTRLSDADTVALEQNNRLVTQALFNDPFVIDRVVDGWAYGYVATQVDARHPQGYPGWVWAAQLSLVPLPLRTGTTVTVKRGFTPLLRPDGSTLRLLTLGTELPVVDSQDHRYDLVQTPLGIGKVAKRATQFAFADQHLTAGAKMVRLGRDFLDLRYLWGGISAYGFDCSGFVYSLHRAIGVRLPRDASDQALMGTTIPLADAQPGDLCFFAHDHGNGTVHHVAMYAGDGWLLHAPTPGKHVTYLQLAATYLKDELVAVKRNW
ncbi:gamma-D-glutamate-meso-diaminopimelate muropeptidase [Lactiplantibacillus xiangfangensis]|uniref:Gamma-D-glutamate-meso-diaminopimelate muropeptidase n=2 Tax=Lactiplantibacillus xiangfangensis TaxID=942150 RepID=A0A0R2M0L8_9LACO|nr:gamma-D-glutamate-meso-diaminopimelate muropeptidase [Lactiplantibacillus xiangfangensis]